jgi:anti-sigma factor RsiW
MTNDPLYQRLLEQCWRRPLTGDEETQLQEWLAAHPEAQGDWEAEAGLNQTLSLLPDAPLPSNFTARVLQAVERESAAAARVKREHGFWLWVHRWLPRGAVAAVLLGVGLVSYHQVQAVRFKGLAHGLTVVSDVKSLPNPQILADFDTIRALRPAPPADEELLALLQ